MNDLMTMDWGRGFAYFTPKCLYCGGAWVMFAAVGSKVTLHCPHCGGERQSYLSLPGPILSDGCWLDGKRFVIQRATNGMPVAAEVKFLY